MTENPEDMPVLDALGRAVPQVAPPPGLRARVLAAALRESIDPPLPAAPASPLPFEPRRDVPAAVPGSGASTKAPWLLAAAAALVAVGTSLGWISARGEVSHLQETIARLRDDATAFLNVRAEFDRERTERERAFAILSARDVTETVLAGVTPAAAARARVYVSPSRGLFFAAEDLPALPAGRTYQLWTIVAGQPVSHGVFDIESGGRAQVVADAPPGPADAFAVTIEPSGGVPSPTGDKVLLGVPAN